MILAGTFPILTISVGVGVLILFVAAIVWHRIMSCRRRAPMEVLVPAEVRPRANQSVSAKPPVGTPPFATPQPETQPAPAVSDLPRTPYIRAFWQVMPQSVGGTHPPKEASYVWE